MQDTPPTLKQLQGAELDDLAALERALGVDDKSRAATVIQSVVRGRKARKNLKVGICGEHGGDPESVSFCHSVGLNYVSCSPYRVPIARLAAAQAAVSSN